MIIDNAWLTNLLLISIRISWLIILTPVRLLSQIPIHIRLILILAISAIITSGLSSAISISAIEPVTYLLKGLNECINGLILALSLFSVFSVFTIAGHLIDSQMGLNIASVLNPQEKNQEPIMGYLLNSLASIVFFASGCHRLLFQSFALSFHYLPPGKLMITAGLKPALGQFTVMFSTAILISAPVIVCLLLVDLGCGIITRNMPQLSVYFITLPLKILLGFALTTFCLQLIIPVLLRLFKHLFMTWDGLLT